LSESDNRLRKLLDSGRSDAEVVTEWYWSALSRPPSPAEIAASQKLLNNTADKFGALQDIAWAVLNAKEFIFRQ